MSDCSFIYMRVLNCRTSGVFHLNVGLKSHNIGDDLLDMTIAVNCRKGNNNTTQANFRKADNLN